VEGCRRDYVIFLSLRTSQLAGTSLMTIEYSIKPGTEAADFRLSPINPAWILEGKPVARVALLSSSADGTASTYYWDCTAGRFNWFYGFDETLHILEGSVTLKDHVGRSRLVVAGDTVFFPAGSSAEWTVDKYIRKLAFCRTPLPGFLISLRGVARRLKRLARGGAEPEPSGLF
jgi:uncharacterized cupin superfamily protein